ncbi:MAG TPA: hypothetical protein VF484_00650 [Candidatus Limnocylindrales bacterium]
MTMLVSLFGMAGRLAGGLLTSALGWASSLLFGRVPRKDQILVTSMMALSFLWLLAVVAFLIPAIGRLLVATTPHPGSVDQSAVEVVTLVLVVTLPFAVGLLALRVVRSAGQRKGAAAIAEVLRGYLVTPVLAALLLFLAGVGMARKVRSWRHGWSDVHVPIVAKPGGYDQLVLDLQDALTAVGLEVVRYDAPRVLTVPARVLAAVSGRSRGRRAAERLIELRSETLRIGIYPSDVAISGTTADRIRARAAILSRLATTSAHETTSAEGQAFEDRLAEASERLGDRGPSRAAIVETFERLDEDLLDLPVPTPEWDVLYRMRLQLERDLLLGRAPGMAAPGGNEKEGPAAA